MRPLLVVFLFVACFLSAPTLAQTPEQAYLDWHQPELEAADYAQRRAAMANAVGDRLLLVPSYHGRSGGYSFRQLDDFWYLTGLEIPASLLVIDGRSGESVVFVPERDPHFESASRPNDFPGRPLVQDSRLWERVGLQAASRSTMRSFLKTHADRTWAINAGTGGPLPTPPTDWFADPTQVQQLIAQVQRSYPGIHLTNAFEAVASVRQVKDDAEIATLRQVARITTEAIAHAAGFIAPGVTERELEAELEAAYKRGGAQRLAFSSIIKSGPNSLWPWRVLAAHNDRRNRVMEDGDLVIFDVGTELNGYVSDIGRTFPVSGRFSDRQREILQMETAVADAIIAAMRPGVTLLELMEVARAATPDEHEPFMQAGLFFGHYIGMSTGDPADYTAPLAPGMVITVEPWYYNHQEGISVFTEDVVLITESGVEVLSADLPRTPGALEALVGRH